MRRIRANAIAILTVAWILGTFYYLWQDNKPQSSAAAAASSASQTRGRSHGQKAVSGRLEIHRDDRTIPLIVSELQRAIKEAAGEGALQESVCCMLMCMCEEGEEDGGDDAQLAPSTASSCWLSFVASLRFLRSSTRPKRLSISPAAASPTRRRSDGRNMGHMGCH